MLPHLTILLQCVWTNVNFFFFFFFERERDREREEDWEREREGGGGGEGETDRQTIIWNLPLSNTRQPWLDARADALLQETRQPVEVIDGHSISLLRVAGWYCLAVIPLRQTDRQTRYRLSMKVRPNMVDLFQRALVSAQRKGRACWFIFTLANFWFPSALLSQFTAENAALVPLNDYIAEAHPKFL